MKIRIVSVPKGTEPEEHREALVGLEFQSNWRLKHSPSMMGGYGVPHGRVIKALRKAKRPEAAMFWQRHKRRLGHYAIEFEPTCLKELPVKRKKKTTAK
jgi:hypothetical protein